jgi:hypothetical protein
MQALPFLQDFYIESGLPVDVTTCVSSGGQMAAVTNLGPKGQSNGRSTHCWPGRAAHCADLGKNPLITGRHQPLHLAVIGGRWSLSSVGKVVAWHCHGAGENESM